MIARARRRAIDQLVVEGAATLLCERWLQRSASDATTERVRDGTDEILNIRLPAARVNTERCDELPRPSHKCYFELRAGVVKAEARRVERSESLDEAEHSSMLMM